MAVVLLGAAPCLPCFCVGFRGKFLPAVVHSRRHGITLMYRFWVRWLSCVCVSISLIKVRLSFIQSRQSHHPLPCIFNFSLFFFTPALYGLVDPLVSPPRRDFAYVARDKNTRILKCHVFRCDTPAKAIATSLHEICSRVRARGRRTHSHGYQYTRRISARL